MNNRKRLMASCAALMLGIPAMAQAQDSAAGSTTAADASAFNDDQIVVTARRREERMQDVPLAVSAVSGASLERANISNVAQLSRAVPSLVSTPGQGGGRSLPNFSIRGLSQQELTMSPR